MAIKPKDKTAILAQRRRGLTSKATPSTNISDKPTKSAYPKFLYTAGIKYRHIAMTVITTIDIIKSRAYIKATSNDM